MRLLVSDRKVEKMRTLKLELKTRETTTLQKPSAKTRHRKVLREKWRITIEQVPFHEKQTKPNQKNAQVVNKKLETLL